MDRDRVRYIAQALGTVVILALPVAHVLQLALFLLFWKATFARISRREAMAAIGACVLFGVLDLIATRHRLYFYWYPDIGTLAAYDPVFFGFLTLHVMRLLKGPRPSSRSLWVGIALAIAFATPYLLTTHPTVLAVVPSAVLALALGLFREKEDLRYVGYLITFGAVWEYTGVHRGQWAYPHPPFGGVPLWFIPMWGGIGLFIRRLVYPWVYGECSDPAPSGGPGLGRF